MLTFLFHLSKGVDIQSKVKFGNNIGAVTVSLPTTVTDVFERVEGMCVCVCVWMWMCVCALLWF